MRWAAEPLAAGFPAVEVTESLTETPTKNLTKEPTNRVGPSVASLAVTLSTRIANRELEL